MDRIELFREYQKVCCDIVKAEAVMYGIPEYTVDIRRLHTKITLYINSRYVSLTLYISGGFVIETYSGDEKGVVSKRSRYNLDGNALPKVLGDLIYDLFDRALVLKKQLEKERKIKAIQRKAEKEVDKSIRSPAVEISDESYLDAFDDI